MMNTIGDLRRINRLSEERGNWFFGSGVVRDTDEFGSAAVVIDTTLDEPKRIRDHLLPPVYLAERWALDTRERWFAHTVPDRVPDQWHILEFGTAADTSPVSDTWNGIVRAADATPAVEPVALSAEEVADKVKNIVRQLNLEADFSPLRTHTVSEDGHSKTFTVMKIVLSAASYNKDAIARVYGVLGEELTEDEGKALSTWVIPGE